VRRSRKNKKIRKKKRVINKQEKGEGESGEKVFK